MATTVQPTSTIFSSTPFNVANLLPTPPISTTASSRTIRVFRRQTLGTIPSFQQQASTGTQHSLPTTLRRRFIFQINNCTYYYNSAHPFILFLPKSYQEAIDLQKNIQKKYPSQGEIYGREYVTKSIFLCQQILHFFWEFFIKKEFTDMLKQKNHLSEQVKNLLENLSYTHLPALLQLSHKSLSQSLSCQIKQNSLLHEKINIFLEMLKGKKDIFTTRQEIFQIIINNSDDYKKATQITTSEKFTKNTFSNILLLLKIEKQKCHGIPLIS